SNAPSAESNSAGRAVPPADLAQKPSGRSMIRAPDLEHASNAPIHPEKRRAESTTARRVEASHTRQWHGRLANRTIGGSCSSARSQIGSIPSPHEPGRIGALIVAASGRQGSINGCRLLASPLPGELLRPLATRGGSGLSLFFRVKQP